MSHHNYYLDLCVDTFVVNEDAVLLRYHDKYDMWATPGGHIEPGEDVNEAAIREVWEEAGIQVMLIGPEGWEKSDTPTNLDLVPPHFVNRHPINDHHDHSSFIFFGTANTREVHPQSEEDKVAEARCIWVTQVELDNMRANDDDLRDETYRYATAALARIAKLSK